jgi:hypothetical protein
MKDTSQKIARGNLLATGIIAVEASERSESVGALRNAGSKAKDPEIRVKAWWRLEKP